MATWSLEIFFAVKTESLQQLQTVRSVDRHSATHSQKISMEVASCDLLSALTEHAVLSVTDTNGWRPPRSS